MAISGGANGGAGTGGSSATGGGANGGAGTGGSSASGGGANGGSATGGSATGGGAAGSTAAGGASTGGAGTGGLATAGAGAGGGTTGGAATGLSLLTDTNRDGAIDASDIANNQEWAWKGQGAFFIANVDDDDSDGNVDASDQVVNAAEDERDLARIIVTVGSDALAQATSISASVTSGATNVHLFEKSGTAWQPVSGALSQLNAECEFGIEATRFADADWDGFATLDVDLLDGATVLESQSVKLRVAPWLMLPSSAQTEFMYIIGGGTGDSMRGGIDAVLQSQGLPACQTPTPSGQDQWYQDTMEIGYTQLPGSEPMHVVMKAQRGMVDDVAAMLLAPDFGFISIGEPRDVGGGFGGDHWMDWMGNLEVTAPVPGYPLGRVYYGRSSATTFHPTIVAFLEAQEVQNPFDIFTEWLVIQHVDEIMNFVTDSDGNPHMIVASPSAANDVLGSGYDSTQQSVQGYMDELVALTKTELGITDADILPLPLYFDGSGMDLSARWSDPVNSIFVNGTFIIGDTDTPEAIKTDIEGRFSALGIDVAWVNDANYHMGGGNVHCGTNAAKTPVCANFAQCL